MSLLNVWHSDTRALVAVDTLCGVAGGPLLPGNKLHVISQAQSVIATRGSMAFSGAIFGGASYGSSCFDDIEGVMSGGGLAEAYANVVRHEAQAAPDGLPSAIDRGQDVLLVGFSHKRCRIAALLFAGGPDGWPPPTEVRNTIMIGRGMFLAGEDPVPTMVSQAGKIGPHKAMHELMAQQVKTWREHPERIDRPWFCGGRCIVGEVALEGNERASISIRDMGSVEG